MAREVPYRTSFQLLGGEASGGRGWGPSSEVAPPARSAPATTTCANGRSAQQQLSSPQSPSRRPRSTRQPQSAQRISTMLDPRAGRGPAPPRGPRSTGRGRPRRPGSGTRPGRARGQSVGWAARRGDPSCSHFTVAAGPSLCFAAWRATSEMSSTDTSPNPWPTNRSTRDEAPPPTSISAVVGPTSARGRAPLTTWVRAGTS